VRFVPTELPGVVVVEPTVHRDARGAFWETWRADAFAAAGLPSRFLQGNRAVSQARVLRGLHLQVRRPQGKLVRVVRGEVFDVAVDVRRGSPTFLRFAGVVLSAENARQCWVPAGFAHGYCVTSPVAEVEYECTELWDPGGELSLAADDPAIGIPWPVADPVLSPRDRAAPRAGDVLDRLPAYAGG
jgi:dTDP-4-dehydrorhamnose 3,5-epimerase